MTEYLSIDELCIRIKFSKQSLYNLIYKRTLVLGVHYFKPTPKKLLFKWEAIQDWVEGGQSDADYNSLNHTLKSTTINTNRGVTNSINI